MLNHKVIQSGGDSSNGGGSLKEYYGVFGLRDGASLEEVTARYMALKKQIISSIEKGQRPEKTIPEINEAYVKLKESKIPVAVNFDLEEHLRKSFTSVRAERRRARRKKIIISSGILAVFLIAGISLFLMESPKEILPPESTSPEASNLKTKGSLEKARSFSKIESKPSEKKAQAIPKEPSKSIQPESAKPVAPKPSLQEPPAVFLPKAEDFKTKEKAPLHPVLKPAPPIEVAKAVPQEPRKPTIPESSRAVTEAVGRVELPRPVPQELPPTPLNEPEGLKTKVQMPMPVPSAPKPAAPAEVAKAIPQELSKPAIPEKPKAITEAVGRVEPPRPTPQEPALTPKKKPEELKTKVEVPITVPYVPKPPGPAEVAKAIPQEPSKPAIAERAKPTQQERVSTPMMEPQELKAKVEPPLVPPPPKTAPPPEGAKVTPRETSKIAKPESAKVPEAVREKEKRVASVSPSAIASDLEVRNFFENYLVKYNRKEINSFIALFSAKAIQNQKDDVEKIRKTYENFFAQMESVNYQIAITGIEPKQDRLEVKAQYELEGIVAKGRKTQNWKGQVRWVLIREDGALKILSLDYKPQSSK